MANLGLMRDGFGLPSIAEQEKALRAHGFTDKDFKPTGFVYTDRKRYKSHREAGTKWLEMLEKQVRPGDVIYVHSPVVFAAGEKSIRERLTFLHGKGAAGVFDCSIGKLVKLNPDSAAVLDFQRRGAKTMADAKQPKMTRARSKVAYEGVSEWTPKHRAAAKQAWLNLPPGTPNELIEIEAARLAGMEKGARIPYRTIHRWSKPQTERGRGWPEKGANFKPPRKRK